MSSGSQSPDLGGMAARKALTGTATSSRGLELSEHNGESLALNAIGQNWSGEKISLFLED